MSGEPKTTDAEPSASDDLALLGERALELVQDDSLIGLGSESAASAFVQALGRRVQRGLRVTCVATSEATARLGAEVALKGFGGALARERVVAAASRRQVLLVRADKLVPALGSRGRLPVEVLPFAVGFCQRKLRELGHSAEIRRHGDRPFVTDNGNFTLDCATGPLTDPARTQHAIEGVPGVVDTGLFLGTAERVLVVDRGAVRELKRREN